MLPNKRGMKKIMKMMPKFPNHFSISLHAFSFFNPGKVWVKQNLKVEQVVKERKP
jgi:hypothetical protein